MRVSDSNKNMLSVSQSWLQMIQQRNINARLIITLLLYFILIFIPLNLYAEESIYYTIQTGSFVNIETAKQQFNSIAKGLNEQKLEFLRIEKIGKYYAIRLGKFKDYSTANKFLRANETHLNGAIIIRARTIHELVDQLLISTEPIASVREEKPVTEKDSQEEIKDMQLTQEQLPVAKPGIFSNLKGRIYLSDYYSNDSDDFDFHILTTRVNVYTQEDNNYRYYYALDARARKRIFSGNLRENTPEYDVDELWLGYKFPKQNLDIIGGRHYIYELYNTRIDGLNVKYYFKEGEGIGIFGGLAPDKHDDSLNTDFESFGSYAFLEKKKYKLHFGYENLSYKGDTDREYFSLKLYSKLNDKMRLNVISSTSINQLTDNIEVENANVNYLYSYSKKLRFNLFYNFYRTIKYYSSTSAYLVLPDLQSSFLLNDASQTRTGVRVDYKLMRKLKVYASSAYQVRDQDDEDSLRLTAGLRKYDFHGFDISARYTHINDFTSVSDEFNVELARNFYNKVDLSIYASREEEKLDIADAYTQGTLTYGVSAYWPINKSYYLSMFLEHYEEDAYDNTSLFTQLGYKL
jgi:hypothetical protein